MLLKLHKLSAKVSIETIKSMHSYYYYNDTAEFDEYLDFIQQILSGQGIPWMH